MKSSFEFKTMVKKLNGQKSIYSNIIFQNVPNVICTVNLLFTDTIIVRLG